MADEPYFTEDELYALPDMDSDRFPSDRVQAAHDWVVSLIERECGTSFVYRTVTDERVTGSGMAALMLASAYVRSVSAVSVDSTAYTTPQVEALYVENGVIYSDTGGYWSDATRGNVTVSYVHGWSATPPADLKEAAMRAARHWLLTQNQWSGVDSRATSISGQDGTFTISTPGPDRPTGLPDVDATIIAWRDRVRVPSVA